MDSSSRRATGTNDLMTEGQPHVMPDLPDNTAKLVDALQGLSTLLLLTAEACDEITSALTGKPVDTAADMYPDSQPDIYADTSAASTRPKLAVVAPIDGRAAADTERTYVRDVEPLSNGRHRGRVRWLDPATKRYQSRSKTFDAPADAWRWVERWVDEHQGNGAAAR